MNQARINADILAGVIGARLVAGNARTVFKGISTDSRRIQKGQLFWALKGERFNGHDFVQQAMARGAAGAVVEENWAGRFSQLKCTILCVRDTLYALGDLAHWWRRQHRAKVAAVTGSVGKTTTKEMAAQILSLSHETLKTEGNLNNLIGLPLTLLRLEERHSRAVVEMGMNRPGEIARLTQIADPDVGVITEVGIAHLEGLGSLLGVARAKLEMAQEMSEDSLLVINGDNEVLVDLAGQYGRKTLSFGIREHNDIRAVEVELGGASGASFILEYGVRAERGQQIKLRVPGLHNVMNGLAAAALCIAMGEDLETISQGLEAFSGIKGRFEIVSLGPKAILIDDTYNANPVSLKAALDAVKDMLHGGRTLVVGLGDMLELGEEAEKAHVEAGMWVGSLDPKLFVCIGEYGKQMIEGARKAGMEKTRTVVAPNIRDMADLIMSNLEEGDIVLLKGSRKVGLDKVRALLVEAMGELAS